MFWGLFKKKDIIKDDKINLSSREKEILSIEREREIKKIFDHSIEPKLWVARFGHTIWCGDFRNSIFPDKVFQQWIYQVFELLHAGKIEELRQELLTEEEIKKIEAEGID